MALAGMDHMPAGLARRRQQPLDRLDRRAGEREVVAHLVDIAADAAEIGLHVDDDQRSVVGPELAVPRPGIGAGFHVHGHLTAPNSPGAPRRLRSGEQVAIISASVSTYGAALKRE